MDQTSGTDLPAGAGQAAAQSTNAQTPPPADRGSVASGMFRALRIHQWAKNLLLFLPLLLAHAVDRTKLAAAAMAYLCFSLCASAAYIINDLNDLQADRAHPRKRRRPFASGQVPAAFGPPMAGCLIVLSAVLTQTLPPRSAMRFSLLLAFYFLLTLSYSFYFKRKLLLDVLMLAGLYTLRVLAGGAAVDVPVTPWLLAFSMFLFLSLAFAKRYTELRHAEAANRRHAAGRAYQVEDLPILPSAGLSSGYMAVLVLALYINDIVHGNVTSMSASGLPMKPHVLYGRPFLLWLICPVLLHWVTRLWFVARRGALHDDPVVFAMKDRVSWLAGAVVFVLALLATQPRGTWGLPF